VNQPSVQIKDAFIDYGELRALVVDDYPGMRNALRLTLTNFGIRKIQLAGNAAEAIFQLKSRPCDFILCDYNLGDGRDGQQLLEELRHSNLISPETVFMMVTAESFYEKVVATAELAPDDYMIKPFSAEVLHSRLESVLQRKRAFRDVHRHLLAHNLEAAILACDEIIRSRPKYMVDALRFKGELLVTLERFAEAEALYQQIIKMRAIPWARLGLARTLHLQKKDEAAEEELRDVLEQAPEMVAAYDLLSDVCLSRKDATAAQAALLQGVAISGKTVRRQQKLGEVALANGDLDTARTAFTHALEKGRHSIFITPSDFGNLCRVQLEQGDLKAVADTLRKNKSTLQSSAEGQLVMAVTQGMACIQDGKLQEASRALDAAGALRAAGTRGDDQLVLDMARVCMANGRLDEADGLVSEVARNAHDSEALLAKAKRIYEEAGRSDAGAAVLSNATSGVRKLNNEGVVLAQRGDYQSAVEKLLTACDEAPYNPRIMMNTVWVILKYLDEAGMDEKRLEHARHYLAEAGRQAPDHPRLSGLRLQLREVEQRFGIKRTVTE
jgi:DNA-binding response OmpR family regulator/Tfp pilus assembly protein PilF